MTGKSLTEKASVNIRVMLREEVVEAVLDALTPEAESPSSDRSSTEVRRDVDGIVISTEASDTTAMRAAVNSYLRWVQGMLEMLSKIE
jgi:tRNA threonylcarbamoyladenosine modification (KEOPS) complex  Pcc1 subunit